MPDNVGAHSAQSARLELAFVGTLGDEQSCTLQADLGAKVAFAFRRPDWQIPALTAFRKRTASLGKLTSLNPSIATFDVDGAVFDFND